MTTMAKAKPNSEPSGEPTQAGRARGRSRGMWPNKWRWRISLILFVTLLLGFAGAWLSRERIAGNLIDEAIVESGVPASYEIESIGTRQQILRNLVVGDPASPDLTAERVIVEIVYLFGSPQIGQVEIVRPRLYGSFRGGVFSFGSLDPILFAESDEPAGLPEFDVKIVDGRARIDSDYGVIGAKIEGEGRLDDGFAGKLAATAPGLGVEGCSAQTASLYGDVTTSGGEPRFEGPVRLRQFVCSGARVMSADIAANLAFSDDFSSLDGAFNIESEELAFNDFSLSGLNGNTDLTWNFAAADADTDNGSLTLRHELEGMGAAAPNVRLGTLSLDGTLRAGNGFERADWDVDFAGNNAGVDLGDGAAFSDARAAVRGTLLESLLGKFESGLTQSLNGGQLAGDLTLRINGGTTNVIVPEARLRGSNGETVLALSRVSYSSNGKRLSGNILTGGANMPRINGRMEQVADGDFALRLTMAEYREGRDAIAIPRLQVRQDRQGRVSFDGLILADGAIPGGSMRGLVLPVEGTWSNAQGLALGNRCTQVRLASLNYAELALRDREISLCPADGRAMLRYKDTATIAAATSDLELIGDVSGTPASITAERAVLRYPGGFQAENVYAAFGEADSALRLSASTLDGSLGELSGRFEGATAALDIIPLDIANLSGTWAFTDGVLRLSEGTFILTERIAPDADFERRFEPVSAQEATLTLENNRITVGGDLRHPATDTLLASLMIAHDLSSGEGEAEFDIPGLRFDEGFQPEDLSMLARGVIALADGTVSGNGELDWGMDDISSTGTFRTQDFDFATVFGPVRGVTGEIAFTDLLNLTSAPSQVVEIDSINPGIETLDGRIVFTMIDAETVRVEDGRWPLMGGEIVLQPTTIINGGRDGQNYTVQLIGIDAAAFVAEAELSNLGASGIFDGTIPITFDALGNGRIEGGFLRSRPPGGNVSYIGELTYEDLGTMSNYVFDTLRSIDYSVMNVELNGSLAGEIITSFEIEGVRQGEGASQNFVTRQINKIPIELKINVRSENFFLLSTIARGLFDPSAFGDPIDQGLIQFDNGKMIRRRPEALREPVPVAPDAPNPSPTPNDPAQREKIQRRDEPTVQPPESDNLP